MNDRWRTKDRIDPLVVCTILVKGMRASDNISYREVLFVRRSRLKEVKEQYGNDLEVLL